jgi:hypothetical protein
VANVHGLAWRSRVAELGLENIRPELYRASGIEAPEVGLGVHSAWIGGLRPPWTGR